MAARKPKGNVKTIQDSKCCPKCGRVLRFDKFCLNNGWTSQVYRDLWCKECIIRNCVDETTLREYCYDNNRVFSDKCYVNAVKKAQKSLMTNKEYLSVTTSEERKKEIVATAITRAYIGLMNFAPYYQYEEHNVTYAAALPGTQIIDTAKELDTAMEYNTKWRGYFTPEQIEILEDTYDQYERDFDLSDASLQDYAMKVVKASFHADQVYDLMRRGEATVSDYKDAQKIFDDLSKSSNFAACRRKPGEATGMGSLGEIILRIEGTGKLNVDGDIWPQDSIDATLNDYRHVLMAAGREGEL